MPSVSAIVVAGAGTSASAGPGAQLNAGRLVVELLAAAAAGGEKEQVDVVVAARTQVRAPPIFRALAYNCRLCTLIFRCALCVRAGYDGTYLSGSCGRASYSRWQYNRSRR